ncbi:hypothetical protein F2Q70_00014264 [Brassica cretica]|uniref:Uncharacterized protein n=1 Tax=Brassica cretica TaxID=69181 RepID=A0A8S9I141_BRACR|nr:hypothetical protein F2Q70_00014264 [Brassica cretica]
MDLVDQFETNLPNDSLALTNNDSTQWSVGTGLLVLLHLFVPSFWSVGTATSVRAKFFVLNEKITIKEIIDSTLETNTVEGVGSGKETTQQQEVDNEAVEKADTSDEVGVDEANNWSLVSPEKVGRSPVATPRGNQREDFHIFVSKFAVLSVDGQEEEQEEEGEIKGPGFQLSDAAFPALETSTKVDKERSVDNQSVVEAAC